MATYTTSAAQTSASGFYLNPPKYIEQGLVARTAQITFTAAQSAGDVFQMVPVPKGAQIADIVVQTQGFTGGLVTFGVGDSASTKRFGSLSSSANNAARPNLASSGYSYSVDATISLLVDAVSTATATGTCRMTVFYSFDQSPDGNS